MANRLTFQKHMLAIFNKEFSDFSEKIVATFPDFAGLTFENQLAYFRTYIEFLERRYRN